MLELKQKQKVKSHNFETNIKFGTGLFQHFSCRPGKNSRPAKKTSVIF